MQLSISVPSYRLRGVIAFWDGESKGTQHNFKLAEDYNNEIGVYNYKLNKFVEV